MSDTTSLNIRISGALREHVMRSISQGDYENASEYVRSLIRADRERADKLSFETMKAQLRSAFAEPESSLELVSASDIRRRAADRAAR